MVFEAAVWSELRLREGNYGVVGGGVECWRRGAATTGCSVDCRQSGLIVLVLAFGRVLFCCVGGC